MTEPIGDEVVVYCRDMAERLDVAKAVEYARATYRSALRGATGQLSEEKIEQLLDSLVTDISELADLRESSGCWMLPLYKPHQPSIFGGYAREMAYGALWLQEHSGHGGTGVVARSLNWERDDAV